jgi:proteic killer suppression protein
MAKEFANFRGSNVRAGSGWKTLDAAASLEDLRALSSNRLKVLHGDREGLFSIRINLQWRICFEWPGGAAGPSNVEIVDYH